jgi:hypothetical protein
MGDEAKPQSPEEVTPAHADAAFPVLLCIGGPAHGQLVERHPAQQSWVHIESAETYIRRRLIDRVQGPLGTPNAYMQQVLAWSKLDMQGIQNLIGQLVTRAWFQAGLPMNITNDMPKSNLIVPNGGKDV